MMQDVQELRDHKWIPRKHIRDVGPKTIYQIRQEVWQDFPGHPGSQMPPNSQMPRNSPPHPSGNWQGRPNYGSKGPLSSQSGRGLNDVFISENEGKGHMFDHDFGNGAIPDHQGPNYGSRYHEDDYDSFTTKDPWANLTISHSPQRGMSPSGSPTSTRHQQYGSRRPPPRPSPLNTDGEISLRPARDSMAAKTLGMTTRAQNQAKLEDILIEYLLKKEDSDAIKSLKNMKAEKYLKDLFLKVIFAGVNRNDEERLLIAQLIQAMYKEGLITKDIIMQGMRNVLEESLNDKDGQNTKEYIAGLSARTVIQGLVSLSEVGKMLEGEKYLNTLLMVLKKLEHMNGQEWLIGSFNESKINLLNCLPEKDRCNETMVEILEEQSLAFLFPLLRIQAELYKKIEDDPNSSNIYKWIKENIDSTLQSQPEFVNVLTTCALKYATHDSTLAKGVDTTQAPDKDLIEKEKYAMRKMKPLLDRFLHEKTSLQRPRIPHNRPDHVRYLKDLFLKVIFAGVNRNDEERLLIAQLIQAMYKEGLITKDIIMQGMRNVLEESLNDKDGQNTKEYIAGLSARTVIQGLVSLSEVGKMLEGEKYLNTLLMVLKKLEHMNGQEWLIGSFNESKINLLNCLPEKDRCNETMVEILEEQSLAFLFPLLRIQAELYKKIEDDPNSSNIYKWIKENIDSTLQSQPEFVNVLTTCALKYATHDSTLAKGVDTTQAPDKDLIEKEKYAMRKMKPLLDRFLHEKTSLQVRALYSLQVFCYTNSFPKGLLLRMFMLLYDLEIVEEEAYVKWKEDVNEDYPGKGKALFQVNTWLTWLETADEEGSESEPE
ncbi:Eukaryotic translation initiation factor 4 gamma 2 [Exaiptasia diaphana]|nr:Eukaryotic translation initiation factor 4 gamma 2 [Exaiptasia diaphana]